MTKRNRIKRWELEDNKKYEEKKKETANEEKS